MYTHIHTQGGGGGGGEKKKDGRGREGPPDSSKASRRDGAGAQTAGREAAAHRGD